MEVGFSPGLVNPKMIFKHPKFNPDDITLNDVAVLRLAQPVNTTIAKPVSEDVSLEPIDTNKVDYAWSAGWGTTNSGTGTVNYDLFDINVNMEACIGMLANIPGLVCARDQSYVQQSTCNVRAFLSAFRLRLRRRF